MPLLFALDMKKKHNLIFKFNQKENLWYVEFEEDKSGEKKRGKR